MRAAKTVQKMLRTMPLPIMRRHGGRSLKTSSNALIRGSTKYVKIAKAMTTSTGRRTVRRHSQRDMRIWKDLAASPPSKVPPIKVMKTGCGNTAFMVTSTSLANRTHEAHTSHMSSSPSTRAFRTRWQKTKRRRKAAAHIIGMNSVGMCGPACRTRISKGGSYTDCQVREEAIQTWQGKWKLAAKSDHHPTRPAHHERRQKCR